MSSTRRHDFSSLEVYQDFADGTADDIGLARSLQNYNTSTLQPSHIGITNSTIVINPPLPQSSQSPSKRQSPQSSPCLNADNALFDSVYFPAPEIPFMTDSPTKKDPFGPSYTAIAPRPQKALFATFPTSYHTNKENDYPTASKSIPGSIPGTNQFYGYAPVLGKRMGSVGVDVQDRPTKKPRMDETPMNSIPDPEDMPEVSDPGGKPTYSYATLIGMAILRASGRKLTLAQIYKWISDTFSFYKDHGTGWQNSIRHNLSLNKAFVKKERGKDDPGKGNYWAIKEGMETQFVKDKNLRRPTNTEQTYYDNPYSEGARPSTSSGLTAYALPPKSARAVDSSKFPTEQELSSDGTVAASDPVLEIGEIDQEPLLPQSPAGGPPSSPPPDMGSSPPVARHITSRGTPSRSNHFSSMSRSGGRTKRVDNFKDSGFWSSIESSVPRGGRAGQASLTSEADQSAVLKRGRAEDEIARMRGSSFDPSPTKNTSVFKKPALNATLNSSSPLRPSNLGLSPLTPGITLRPPIRAPPTVSPNTHLRRHRESVRQLVGTPARNWLPADNSNWSPAFALYEESGPSPLKLKDVENIAAVIDSDDDRLPAAPKSTQKLEPYPSLSFSHLFEFEEHDEDGAFENFFSSGSPVAKKTSNKRPALQRASTATGVLGDVTGSRANARLASPFRMLPPSEANKQGASPAKKSAHLKADAFWGRGSSSPSSEETERPSKKAKFDLAMGFSTLDKIYDDKENKENVTGAGQMAQQKPVAAKASRPGLMRSSTNLY